MAYLTLTAMLMLVLWPLWVPAVINGSQAIATLWRKSPRLGMAYRREMLATSRAA